jgi:His-Xaa-Ser system radical SAM maturase HxsB
MPRRGRPPAYFRFRRVPGRERVVVTNDVGDAILLSPPDFETFAAGRMTGDHPAAPLLAERGFFADDTDVDFLAWRWRRRNEHLERGPDLHMVVTTLRCNELCLYCHAARTNMDHAGVDMSLATAKRVVDVIFQTPSRRINIEFQGGEPTANWPALQFVVEYAREKNKLEGRDLALTLVSNLALMTEERMTWLIDRGVAICTSLDGPRDLHDWNRRLAGGSASAYDETVAWMDRFHAEYRRRGLPEREHHVDALMTTTVRSLSRARDIVDEYVRRGIKVIHLRPLNPFGFAADLWWKIGYRLDEYIGFWTEAMTHILEVNRAGTTLIERGSSVLLSRILGDDDAAYADLRSPSGAGLASLAYFHDGSVYTCDEGRMLGKTGDDTFKLGHVDTHDLADLLRSPTVAACARASVVDALPGCADCAYAPYCGARPVYNWATQRRLVHEAPTNLHCRHQLAVFDRLFAWMEDGETRKVFEDWIVKRPRITGIDAAA